MITVRQVEKLWTAHQYRRLATDLIACRPEASRGRTRLPTLPVIPGPTALAKAGPRLGTAFFDPEPIEKTPDAFIFSKTA